MRDRIRSYIVDRLMLGATDAELNDDTSLIEMGIIDSTGIVELIAFLEKEFLIRIEDEEIVPENFDSLRQICGYLKRKRGPLIPVAFSNS